MPIIGTSRLRLIIAELMTVVRFHALIGLMCVVFNANNAWGKGFSRKKSV